MNTAWKNLSQRGYWFFSDFFDQMQLMENRAVSLPPFIYANREAVGNRKNPRAFSRIAAISLIVFMVLLTILSFSFAITAIATHQWIWLCGTFAAGLTVIALSIFSYSGCRVKEGSVLIGHQFDRIPPREAYTGRRVGNLYTKGLIPTETGNLQQ